MRRCHLLCDNNPWRIRAACSWEAEGHRTRGGRKKQIYKAAFEPSSGKDSEDLPHWDEKKLYLICTVSIGLNMPLFVFFPVMSFLLFMSLWSRWNVPLFLSQTRTQRPPHHFSHKLFGLQKSWYPAVQILPDWCSPMISCTYHIPAFSRMNIQDTRRSYFGVCSWAFYFCSCVVLCDVTQAAVCPEAVKHLICLHFSIWPTDVWNTLVSLITLVDFDSALLSLSLSLMWIHYSDLTLYIIWTYTFSVPNVILSPGSETSVLF